MFWYLCWYHFYRSGWRPICNPQDQLHDVDMFHLSKSEAMCLPFLVALSGSLILHVVTGQQWVPNTGCDYQQDVVPDRTYYVYSPNYPSLYPRGIQCRWIARAPTRSKIVLNCSSFSLPFVSI
ncbi:hypothetical protein C0J52_20413 [Blattella germanica]|nr:hypothetical protein C0J52_20413 [Blattella germanica]